MRLLVLVFTERLTFILLNSVGLKGFLSGLAVIGVMKTLAQVIAFVFLWQKSFFPPLLSPTKMKTQIVIT